MAAEGLFSSGGDRRLVSEFVAKASENAFATNAGPYVPMVPLMIGDDGVRSAAVGAQLQTAPQPATEVGQLVDALHSKVNFVRFHAAIALGDFGHQAGAATPDLIHASLWDEEPAVRVKATMALWKIDQKKPLVLQVLTEALDDANELTCRMAAECLGQIGPAARDAVPALRQALERDFRLSLVKTSVRLALERIDPPAE